MWRDVRTTIDSAGFFVLDRLLSDATVRNLIEAFDRETSSDGTRQKRGIVFAIAPGDVDMMICAMAQRLKYPIFTNDADFALFAKVLPIQLVFVFE